MSESESTKIRVLIIDDHRMFADSLARLLRDEDDLEVVGIAGDGAQALKMVDELQPTIALVDYKMPDIDGVEVARQIKTRAPDTYVVMLTGSADDRTLVMAIEAGCSGYLNKESAADEVVRAVRLGAAGEALISPRELARLLPRLTRKPPEAGSDLTEREREVLALLADGTTNQTIAAQLHLSVNTVRNYVQSILTKLGAHSKLEAVSIGVRSRIIDYPGTRVRS